MPVISVDVESYLIRPGLVAPKLVCVTASDGNDQTIYDARDGVRWVELKLRSDDVILVGHNIAFDLGVICAEKPELLRLVFAAYEKGRIRDTRIREKLHDIAIGEHRFYLEHSDDEEAAAKHVRSVYTLERLVWKHFRRQLPKEGTWRLRYSELIDVPLAQWPPEAKEYALRDAWETIKVFESQERWGKLADELPQTKYAWSLHLVSAWGMRTDGEAVTKLKAELEQEYGERKAQLRKYGFIRESGSKNMAAIKQVVEQAYADAEEVPKTAKGATSTDADTLKGAKDERLQCLLECNKVEKILGTFVPMLEQGVVYPITCSFDSLRDSGRVSAFLPNIQQLPRKGNVRQAFIPRNNYLFVTCDYDTAELRALAQVCLKLLGKSRMAEALLNDQDLHSAFAATLMGISYEEVMSRLSNGDKECEDKRQFAKCFHPDTEALTRTGWKRIGDLQPGEQVIQATPEQNKVSLEWVAPTQLIRKKNDSGILVHLKNTAGIDLRVTPDHRMVVFTSKSGNPKVVTPYEVPAARTWANVGVMFPGHEMGLDREIDDKLLRLAVATQADGHYSKLGHQITFGFTKRRKIERLRELLQNFQVDQWAERCSDCEVEGKPVTTFVLQRALAERVKVLLDHKKLPWSWLGLPLTSRILVLEELPHWDGHVRANWRMSGYYTCEKQNADVVQALAALTGRKTHVQIKKRGEYPDLYRVSIRRHWYSRGDNVQLTEIPYTDDVVCLSVPSSFVLVRDQGIPMITGQCFNFGAPGGLGAASFVEYARNYNVYITEDEARFYLNQWHRQWPEMREYFELAAKSGDSSVVVQLFSNRVRGRLSFTQWCNTWFQGLIADLAKSALWKVSQECYTDSSSPLFSSRIVAFLHDEIMLESPEDKASDAAKRLQHVMVTEGKRWLPDIPVKASPVLMRRWHKGARSKQDESGNLLPVKPVKEQRDGRDVVVWAADL